MLFFQFTTIYSLFFIIFVIKLIEILVKLVVFAVKGTKISHEISVKTQKMWLISHENSG